jgi:molybdopterin molybdotransferase
MEPTIAGPTTLPLMISVEEAQARVLAEVPLLEAEQIALADAGGRVLREDVHAPADVPEGDNTAMDGYAVRAGDVAAAPISLRVIGDLPAGRVPSVRVEPGTAVRIMTGALIPEGADTVINLELTDGETDVVRVEQALPRGANVRRRGEDMRAGDLLLAAGSPLRAAEIGVLAAAQRSSVAAGRRPSVAIFSTGDEVVEIDEPRTPGKIVNSNAWALAALVREAGAIPRPLGIVRDDLDATIRAFEAAMQSDFIVSSGGVSVGAYDFVKDALAALGAETRFWRIAMKPGKPVVLSRLRDRVVFGLPGNPVSCMVSFHLFVAPALRKSMGQSRNLLPPVANVRLTAPLASKGDRRNYLRVRVVARGGVLEADPMRAQGSGVSTSMLQANGLAVVEPGVTRLDAGAGVSVVLIAPIDGE